MAAHKHAKMIKAKADNMDLVLLRKTPTSEYWEICRSDWMPTDLQDEFFLCLPQRKEACLHWLNGGEVEFNSEFVDDWTEYEPIKVWGLGSVFMQDDYKIRIKPLKEKRHIYISKLGATTYAKKTKEEAAREVSIMGGSFEVWKHYEIEIEVEI